MRYGLSNFIILILIFIFFCFVGILTVKLPFIYNKNKDNNEEIEEIIISYIEYTGLPYFWCDLFKTDEEVEGLYNRFYYHEYFLLNDPTYVQERKERRKKWCKKEDTINIQIGEEIKTFKLFGPEEEEKKKKKLEEEKKKKKLVASKDEIIDTSKNEPKDEIIDTSKKESKNEIIDTSNKLENESLQINNENESENENINDNKNGYSSDND